MRSVCGLAGAYQLTYHDPAGVERWRLAIPNGVTVQGADHYNDVLFGGTPPVGSWRLGVISDAGFDRLRATDTHASHPGWVEFQAVLGGTRPEWNPATSASGRKASAAPAAIQITAAGAVRGVFLASRPTAGDVAAAGVLFSTAVADAARDVEAGGVLSVSYTIAGG